MIPLQRIQELAEKYHVWIETLTDIFAELARPGLDPREDIPLPNFKSEVMEIEDVNIGMILDGVVRNVVDFGAFVDVGLHNDGLVHRSELANRFIRNPADFIHVGQSVKVKVLSIDREKERISLSMKGL